MNRKGFTLLEVLVALVITSVSLLGLAQLMLVTTRSNSFANQVTEASTLAQDLYENMRATDYNLIASGQDTTTGSTGINYYRIWIVEETPPPNIMKSIACKVKWEDLTKHEVSFLYVISSGLQS